MFQPFQLSRLCFPGERECLDVGEALHGFNHAFLVAIAGVLDATKRRHLDPIPRHFPDIDGTDLETPDVFLHATVIIGADA